MSLNKKNTSNYGIFLKKIKDAIIIFPIFIKKKVNKMFVKKYPLKYKIKNNFDFFNLQ